MNTQYEPWTAWRIVVLLLAFMTVNFADKIVVGMLAVPIMTELRITPTQFGIIGSSFFWLFSSGGIAGGLLSRRVATRWLLLAMALAWAIFQIPLVFSTSLAIFVMARMALGLTEGPAYPLAIHAAYKWFPASKRILPVSIIGVGTALGLMIAGVAVPQISLHWGWRANFSVLFAVGLAWSLVWLAFGKDGMFDDVRSAGPPRALVRYRLLLTDPTILASMLMQFVSYWASVLLFTWLPAYFQKGLGYDAPTAGRLFALAFALGTPLSIFVSLAAQGLIARGTPSRIARGWSVAVCQVLGGTAFMCLILPSLSLVAREAAIVCVIAFGTFSYAMCPAIIDEVTPVRQRGAILSICNSIAAVAGVIAPVVTGRMIEASNSASGYEKAFLLSGALLVAGSLIGLVFVDPARSLLRLGHACPETADDALAEGSALPR